MKRTSSYTRLGCETYASTSSVKTSPSLEFRTPPNTDHCERNEYVKRPAEKLIYNLIYDIVLAPILAATRTILSLSLNLMTIFALSAGSMRLFYELYNTIIDDKRTTLIFADLSTSIILLLYCCFLPKYPSFFLGFFVSLSSIITGLTSIYLGHDTLLSTGLASSFTSVMTALLFWLFIERDQRTMASILSHHYENCSSLKVRDKKQN